MNASLNRYVHLLKQSGQVERVNLDDETVLNRGFCIFIGILIGLAMAWMWK